MTDEGKGLRRGGKQRRYPGRLPPVVSSLFSIKAAHWRNGIRGTELGARGKERTARQRRVISYGFSVIEGCRRHACLYRLQQNQTSNFKHQTSSSTNLL